MSQTDDDEALGAEIALARSSPYFDLLHSLVDLNLTLTDGRVVSPLHLNFYELVRHCDSPVVQRVAAAFSEPTNQQR